MKRVKVSLIDISFLAKLFLELVYGRLNLVDYKALVLVDHGSDLVRDTASQIQLNDDRHFGFILRDGFQEPAATVQSASYYFLLRGFHMVRVVAWGVGQNQDLAVRVLNKQRCLVTQG